MHVCGLWGNLEYQRKATETLGNHAHSIQKHPAVRERCYSRTHHVLCNINESVSDVSFQLGKVSASVHGNSRVPLKGPEQVSSMTMTDSFTGAICGNTVPHFNCLSIPIYCKPVPISPPLGDDVCVLQYIPARTCRRWKRTKAWKLNFRHIHSIMHGMGTQRTNLHKQRVDGECVTLEATMEGLTNTIHGLNYMGKEKRGRTEGRRENRADRKA